MDSLKDKIKAWFIKAYRYLFIPTVHQYPVPNGHRLYEMDLLTRDIHKAEYHIVNKQRVLVKKPYCIYQEAKDLHSVKEKFNDIIQKSIYKN